MARCHFEIGVWIDYIAAERAILQRWHRLVCDVILAARLAIPA
jgi:hypothetical protein